MKSSIIFLSIFFYTHMTYANHLLMGDAIAVGNGTANSFVELNPQNQPITIGIALTEDALEGLLPIDQTFTLSLPQGVDVPPYKHILLNWNPKGHEPEGIYDIPHFDFHFYGISEADRLMISCLGEDSLICAKQPSTEFIAPFYAPTPAGVPEMGWHWFDTRSPEFHGQRFTSTFIYGYYNGILIFSEPMITREFLLAKRTVNDQLSVPMNYSIKGYYPKRYTVNYETCGNRILIALEDLTKNE